MAPGGDRSTYHITIKSGSSSSKSSSKSSKRRSVAGTESLVGGSSTSSGYDYDTRSSTGTAGSQADEDLSYTYSSSRMESRSSNVNAGARDKQRSFDDAKARINGLEGENEQLKEKLDYANREIRRQKREKQEYFEDVARLRDKVKALSAQAEKTEEYRRIARQKSDKLAEIEQDLKELRAELRKAKEDLRDTKQDRAELREENRDLREKLRQSIEAQRRSSVMPLVSPVAPPSHPYYAPAAPPPPPIPQVRPPPLTQLPILGAPRRRNSVSIPRVVDVPRPSNGRENMGDDWHDDGHYHLRPV